MIRFIDGHRDRFGIEPICRTLQVAPSSYYAAKQRAPSARARRDQALKPEVQRVHRDHFGVYGIEKIWRQLSREQIAVGRDRVQRLMRELKLAGVVRGRRIRTTIAGPTGERPPDLVDRQFAAAAPNRLWVADLTYVPVWSGFAYTALIIDVFSRRIVGWRVASSLQTELALDALEMALWVRRPTATDGLVHHSDRGVQYLAIRYTARLAQAGVVTSVGSRGDSYDNALAETVMGLYKTELIRRRGPWRTTDQVELATAEWVDWWNHRRLHSAVSNLPPAEFEQRYHDQRAVPGVA
jgi:putative transposase